MQRRTPSVDSKYKLTWLAVLIYHYFAVSICSANPPVEGLDPASSKTDPINPSVSSSVAGSRPADQKSLDLDTESSMSPASLPLGLAIPMLPSPKFPRPNIRLYRNEMNKLISTFWKNRAFNPELAIEIGKEGQLVDVEVWKASGDKLTDSAAVTLVKSIQFPPLPPWYLGTSIPFRVDFSRLDELETDYKTTPAKGDL